MLVKESRQKQVNLMKNMYYTGGCLVFNWFLEVGRKMAAQLPAGISVVTISVCELQALDQLQYFTSAG